MLPHRTPSRSARPVGLTMLLVAVVVAALAPTSGTPATGAAPATPQVVVSPSGTIVADPAGAVAAAPSQSSRSWENVYVIDSYEQETLSYFGSSTIRNFPTPFTYTAGGSPTDIRFSFAGSGRCSFQSQYVIYCTGAISEFYVSAYWRTPTPLDPKGVLFKPGAYSSVAIGYSLDVAYLPSFTYREATPPPTDISNSILSWFVSAMTNFSASIYFDVAQPKVSVKPEHPLDGRYLAEVAAENEVKVLVNWGQEQPGTVDFLVNGAAIHAQASGDGKEYAHTFDMGQDLRPGANSFGVVVYDAKGKLVHEEWHDPCQASVPTWLRGLIASSAVDPLNLNKSGSVSVDTEYESGFRLPIGGVNLHVPLVGLLINDTNLSFDIGGKLKAPIARYKPMELEASVAGKEKVRFVGITLEGSLAAKGKFQSLPYQCEFGTPYGEMSVAGKVVGKRSWPVLQFVGNYVPGLGTVLSEALLRAGLAPSQVPLGAVALVGEMEAGFGSGMLATNQSPYVYWSRPFVELKAGAKVEYSADVVVAELKLFVGARGEIKWQRNGEQGDLSSITVDEANIIGEAGYETRLLWWTDKGVIQLKWQLAGTQLAAVPAALPEGAPRLIAPQPGQGQVFAAVPAAKQAFGPRDDEVASIGPSISPLVRNVYAAAEPALAVNPANGSALLLWGNNDPAKPAGQSHEISFSAWNGSQWGQPRALTNDTLLDGKPSVAWVNADTAVAVWHRLKQTLPADAPWGEAAAGAMEIATATYSRATGQWSPVTLLTNNAVLDHTPLLARGQDGRLLAAWRSNAGALLVGNEAHPDQLMVAAYNNGWGAPQVAAANLTGTGAVAVGYGQNAATLAYTRNSAAGQQLMASDWNGSTWSAARLIAESAAMQQGVQVVYNSANQPLVLWTADNILRLKNVATGTTADLELPPALGSPGPLTAVQDQAGNIAAVFAAHADNQDLYMAYYDQSRGMWGLPAALTNTRDQERSVATAMDGSGRLLLGYVSTALQDAARQGSVQGSPVLTYTVPTEGQSDLYTLSYAPGTNLSMSNGEIGVSNPFAAPGETVTISATLRNSGAKAIAGATVSFYDGDPAAGGALIGTSTLAEPLRAQGSSVVTAPYQVPASAGPRNLYAVADPAGIVAELDEHDNRATLAAFGPDVAIIETGVAYLGGSSMRVQTLVQNRGTAPSARSELRVFRNGGSSYPVAVNSVPPLNPGESRLIETPWSYGTLAKGSYELTAICNQNAASFAEVYLANNEATLPFQVLPDLETTSSAVTATSPRPGAVAIKAKISNISLVDSAATTIGVYVDKPGDAGSRIATWTVAALKPLDDTTLEQTIQLSGKHRLYLVIDPDLQAIEATRANNMASIAVDGGAPIYRVMLPLARR